VTYVYSLPSLAILDRCLTMHIVTKVMPIIIIAFSKVYNCYITYWNDYNLFNWSYRVHLLECPWGGHADTQTHCGQKQFQKTSHAPATVLLYLPASQHAVRPVSSSAMAPVSLHNKGNCCLFTRLLYWKRFIHCAISFPLIFLFLPFSSSLYKWPVKNSQKGVNRMS